MLQIPMWTRLWWPSTFSVWAECLEHPPTTWFWLSWISQWFIIQRENCVTAIIPSMSSGHCVLSVWTFVNLWCTRKYASPLGDYMEKCFFLKVVDIMLATWAAPYIVCLTYFFVTLVFLVQHIPFSVNMFKTIFSGEINWAKDFVYHFRWSTINLDK